MKYYFSIVIILLGLLCVSAQAQPLDVSVYAWQFPRATQISGANDLITELQVQVQQILNRGHLTPLMLRYTDQIYDAYFLYQEPGRIITTLAWAYPYLTADQQQSVRAHIATELQSPNWAPWAGYPLPRADGARRELYPVDRIWGDALWMGNFRPYVHTIYGLWLYAYRSGDWAMLQPYLNNIESFYNNNDDQGRIYGSASADIGMARIADHFNRTASRTQALNNLQTHLTNGLDFTSVENFCRNGNQGWDAPYGPQYNSRNDNLIYPGWMFLNMSPEIGRYLKDHHLAEVSQRDAWANQRFPLWWLSGAQYFCRWAGDESIGIPSEMFGMVIPVERWVLDAPANELRARFRSVPVCVGDCYWLEGLVTAIEANGRTTWTDVRAPEPVADLTIHADGANIVLNWTATDALSYNIYSGLRSDSIATLRANVMSPTATFVGEADSEPTRFYRVLSVR